ncbi:MAG: enoyl-CoA hydratase/isomerase family protein [Deltaproteobacteria bacterium]|nr:enoyl-CoA hydratase/isomerase family protein [Deltaproteobacteria bacterium]
MEYQHIIYEPGKVARIILNRPQYRNAQSWLMREEMDHAFDQAAENDEVGAIILSGMGDNFSAGHDTGTKEDREYREAIGRAGTDRLSRYKNTRYTCLENTLRWRNVPKPTLAMVKGYCIFGGWMFASAMDILFAAESALFLPSHFQYFSVPWDIGPRKAKEILYEHRFMTAWEAYEYGFINRVFSEEKLEEETLAYADRVADNYLRDPFRLRTVKFSVNHMMDGMGFTTELEAGYQSYSTMMGLTPRELPDPKQGGLARAGEALEQLERSKPWLKTIGRE